MIKVKRTFTIVLLLDVQVIYTKWAPVQGKMRKFEEEVTSNEQRTRLGFLFDTRRCTFYFQLSSDSQFNLL